jgi:spore coat protein U-like protein
MFLKHSMRMALFAAVAVVGAGLAGNAVAGSATGALTITASVANNCIIDATDTLAFGPYDPIVTNLSTPLDAAGTINVTCTTGASATVTIAASANATGSGSTAQRRMTDGTHFLNYNLFTENTHTTAFAPDNSAGSALTGSGVSQAVSVYGRVPAAQNVPAASYSDTVVTTVTF